MPSVYQKTIIRYVDANGRRVPKDTPGAHKVKEKSAKWYGRVPGEAKPRPLCTNKNDAETMLRQLVREAEFRRGVLDADMARVLDTWPALPAYIRAAILSLIDAAADERTNRSPLR